ncbi:hypothetical protein JCM19241_1442 [Vibrio ishigakensis]|uniref:Uncharacterized protein n=1 Tax=Vibrio ishigakensis TaxID=1481914 RepID=A0A0B8QKS5_9VIBR|nr:hypothetical protein JCM19241_1442 [Vibrio ishigakensis]
MNDLAKAAFMYRFHYMKIVKFMYGVTPRNCLKDFCTNKATRYKNQLKRSTDPNSIQYGNGASNQAKTRTRAKIVGLSLHQY